MCYKRNLVMYKNGLIREMRLILNFIKSQPDLQTIRIHILPNISRRKGNQTMKFGQLIRGTFLLKNHTLFLLYANLRTIEM